MSSLATKTFTLARSIFVAMGFLWLPLEAYEGLSNSDVEFGFVKFLAVSIVIGVLFFFIDGCFLTGFLKKSIKITSNSFDTEITVKFGDLFDEQGWKSIAVNDFFDSLVDGIVVSPNSLHGQVLNRYWGSNVGDWDQQIELQLKGEPISEVQREKGKLRRYSLGTTGHAEAGGNNFLFVALGVTDATNYQANADAEHLISAVRGLLAKARILIANDTLVIPLMGSGLARVGIKNSVLVDLILTAIFEETKNSKVCDSIVVVLPRTKRGEINLGTTLRNWS